MTTTVRTGRVLAWAAGASLLLVPLVAMQFTDEVAWSAGDFALFAVMLASVGGAIEWAVASGRSLAWRAGVILSAAITFGIVWVSGAVGIVGAEDHPANLLFLAVPAIGLLAAAIGGFRPRAMVRAALVTALAQAAAGAIALAAVPSERRLTLAATAVLLAAWLLASLLFSLAPAPPATASPAGNRP